MNTQVPIGKRATAFANAVRWHGADSPEALEALKRLRLAQIQQMCERHAELWELLSDDAIAEVVGYVKSRGEKLPALAGDTDD